MRCGRSRELISESLDRRLSEHRNRELLEHLTDCEDCRRHHRVLERGQDLLRAGMVEAPENLEWKVQLGIQRALRERVARPEATSWDWRFWGRTVVSAAAVAAVVVVAGSLWLPEGSGPTGEPSSAAVAVAEESGLAPDLSGALVVDDFEIDALSKGYGIRTVGGQGPVESLREHYPVAGRQFYRSGSSALRFDSGFEDQRLGVPSTFPVLQLRLSRPKLLHVGEPDRGVARADSQVSSSEPRR